jgi:hypothetical protein
MIWVAATQPRFVQIKERQPPEEREKPVEWLRRPGREHRKDPIYLYSSSPIPPLLHTCSESRSALQKDGYKLAFGMMKSSTYYAEASDPRIWFHFEKDALYRDWLYYDILKFVAKEDLAKVKRIAIRCSLVKMCVGQFASPYQNPVSLRHFVGLNELLLVETYCADHEEEGNLLGYLECDIADVLKNNSGAGLTNPLTSDRHSLIERYAPQIRKDNLLNREWTRDFFQNLARDFEKSMWLPGEIDPRKEHFIITIGSCFYQTGWGEKKMPKVKIVHLVTAREARQLLKRRETFWGSVQAIEDREAAMGPTMPDAIELKWEEDWKAFDEEYGELGVRARRSGPEGFRWGLW